MRLSWDIFCTVIDNFGDIGVCWRLARQIAAERGEPVRLWVDDLAALQVLKPELDSTAACQLLDGVAVHHWSEPFATTTPQAVVIEAFACHPPASFLAAMAAASEPPVWINLEYLSAEDWVEGCHGLGSRHPRLPLDHQFFFPGFTAATGGLLREAALLATRARWQTDPAAQQHFLRQLGVDDRDLLKPTISLFCYDNAALPPLLRHWAQTESLCLLVTDGKARRQVADWLGQPFEVGDRLERGGLSLIALPFLSQDDYDRLLWSCQLNFVRGEDSFVRAQWAARPLVWHIYPQEEEAHHFKLAAFLQRYAETMPAQAGEALQTFWHGWSQGDGNATVAAWPALRQAMPALAEQGQNWCASQARHDDLLTQLARFAAAKADRAD